MVAGRNFLVVLVACFLSVLAQSEAADLISSREQAPKPPVNETSIQNVVALPSNPVGDEKSIWGAIAYSPSDGQRGIFWGAAERQEAENEAMKLCGNAKGAQCQIVAVSQNFRHLIDRNGSDRHYERCSALSVGAKDSTGLSVWGASAATTRHEAEEQALSQCGGPDKKCVIREWVCT